MTNASNLDIKRGHLDSYVAGQQVPFLSMGRIGNALRHTATDWPDFEALVSVEQEIRLTWSELDKAVDELASGCNCLTPLLNLMSGGQSVAERERWHGECAEEVPALFSGGREH